METSSSDDLDELRLAKLKKETLRQTFDLAHAQASSVLLFTLQWKEVEQHFDSTMKSLEKKNQEVELNKRLLEQRANEIDFQESGLILVQKKIEECNVELESKEEKLGLVQKKIEECSCVIQLKENELNSVKGLVDDWSEKLSLKKQELDVEMKELERLQSLIEDRSEKYELKNKELRKIQNNIEECASKLAMKEKHVDSIELLIQDFSEELRSKENLYDAMKKSLEWCESELLSKKKELELTETSYQEHMAEVRSREKKLDSFRKQIRCHVRVLQLKGKDLDSVKEKVKTYQHDLELKEREFNQIQLRIEECTQEVTLKEGQLELVQKSIEECQKELKGNEDQFYSIQNSMKKLSEDHESKELQFVVIQTMASECLEEINESIEECQKELKRNEDHLYSIQNSMKKLSEDHESKELQFVVIETMASECLKELKEKEQNFELLKKSLEDRLHILEVKEGQFEERVKEFELKEKRLDSIRKAVEDHSKEVELKEKQLTNIHHSQVRTEQPESLPARGTLSPSVQPCIAKNGRNLQFVLNELLKNNDLVHGKVSTTLKTASDPAKLVLDAMQGFYPAHSMEGNMEFDVSIIRRSCIILLEQLLSISAEINPQVRHEAMKLAGEWKAKMRVAAENRLEVLGFLQLLVTFRLASSFDRNEIQSLLDSVDQYRQTPELRRALESMDKAPVTHILPSQVKTEQSELVPVNNAIYPSSASLQIQTYGKSLPSFVNEHLFEHDLTHNEVSAVLRLSPDPAKFVLDEVSHSVPWKKGGTCFEEVVIRYCIFLLEQLKEVSPEINPEVKAEATKLVVEWKTKLRAVSENSLEVLGFLQFLTAYQLVYSFNRAEILNLLRIVAQHKQTPELCRALGFVDVSGFVWYLIERKQYIEALRFSCAFELMDKVSPIVDKYLDHTRNSAANICNEGRNSLDAKEKAINYEVTALSALVECIEDYKLQSSISPDCIKQCISELEKRKAEWRHYAAAPPSPMMIQQQYQDEKNLIVGASAPGNHPSSGLMFRPQNSRNSRRSISASPSSDQLQLQNYYKRPRVDSPVIRSYSPQSSADPANLHSSSSAGWYGPGMAAGRGQSQFGLANMSAGQQYLNHSQPKRF